MVNELRQQLDQERRAHQKAIDYAKSLENVLQALRGSANLQQLLASLLRVLVDHVGAISGVLWLREAESLHCASGLGVAVDIASLGELGLQQIFGNDSQAGPKLESDAIVVPRDHPLCRCLESESEALCVPLRNGEALVAVACLAWRQPQLLERSSHDQLMLLAGHAAVALAEQITQESLMRSLQARDEILGIVAHDLRNPLNVIAAASSSLHMRLPDSLARRPVERIMRAAQRAER